MTKHRASFLLAAVCAAAAAGNAWGNPQGINTGYWMLHLPFDLEPFEPLSGKALGMGNAAVAAADDATAAVINPGALIELDAIDLTASLRYSSYDTGYMDTYAALHNMGVGPDLEENRTFSDDIGGFSFLGAAMPVIPGKLAAALYYKDSSFQAADTQKAGPAPALNLFQQHISEKKVDEYQKSTYGAAGALQIGKHVSVGAAVNLETLNSDLQERFTINTYSGSALASASNYDSRIQGDDSDFTVGVGALFKPMPGLSAGLSYRQGSSFSVDYASGETTCIAGSCSGSREKGQAEFAVPDIWAAGVTWKPLPDWLLAAQADLVEYSALSDGSTAGVTLDEEIEDGVIYRFGAEKGFPVSNVLHCQLRAGFFHIPDHDGFQAMDSARMYWTLGGGVVWREVEANLGASFSEDTFDSVLSLSYRL